MALGKISAVPLQEVERVEERLLLVGPVAKPLEGSHALLRNRERAVRREGNSLGKI
jgi:hypothetical protein